MQHWLTILANRGQAKKAVSLSFDQLTAFFSSPIATRKDELPLVVGALFEDGVRHKTACLGRTIAALDFDDGTRSFDALLAELRNKELRAVVHTTASHTIEVPRLRAFVELDRAVLPPEWDAKIKPWLRSWGSQDENALDITRITYAPVRIEGYRCETT